MRNPSLFLCLTASTLPLTLRAQHLVSIALGRQSPGQKLLQVTGRSAVLVLRADAPPPCSAGQSVCDGGCISCDVNCCRFGNNAYCDKGECCTSQNLCCPLGKACPGPGACKEGFFIPGFWVAGAGNPDDTCSNTGCAGIPSGPDRSSSRDPGSRPEVPCPARRRQVAVLRLAGYLRVLRLQASPTTSGPGGPPNGSSSSHAPTSGPGGPGGPGKGSSTSRGPGGSGGPAPISTGRGSGPSTSSTSVCEVRTVTVTTGAGAGVGGPSSVRIVARALLGIAAPALVRGRLAEAPDSHPALPPARSVVHLQRGQLLSAVRGRYLGQR
ncbi:hypothetical protein jhhlp_007066 [Lomentospora prolificans]|uniref:Granulins domain-containing protein n=1 Tax=Lomentospora prolificans TaxID=41688 RepID=A0A2N3N1K5_9PEZI|nr:hypothetical protein jhhlp_007066 [Lomentospora prolificans]